MAKKVEFATCPACGQKLAVYPYVVVGSNVVCANPRCNTSVRVTGREPIQVTYVPIDQTRNPDNRPESYG
jgi:alpha-aminoadipate/glutamate carrier protein LysW